MEREGIKVKPGFEFDHYFPKAKLGTITKKKGATVADTLLLIPEIVRISAAQTRRFAHEVIKADTVEETCRRLWHFVYEHIAYKKDEEGKEQVRDAARIWHDRHNTDPLTGEPMGVDCDCMTVFVASVLYNLGIQKIFFRITKYPDKYGNRDTSKLSWSHIYPVVILPGGKQITVDCVVNQFNYEEPYLQKKDTPMDLEYLNGVPENYRANADTQDLMGMLDEQQALSELGKIFKKKAAAKRNAGGGDAGHQKKKGGLLKKIGKGIGKGLHVINRINPATMLLRGGILAAMKLNFLKIAGGLRWSYLSEEAAKAKGVIMDKYHKLVKIREKLEKIFFGAGGKAENLRKAMLKGHGNKDKSVQLAGFDPYDSVAGLNEDMSLRQLLGMEMYHSEYVDGVDGLAGFDGFGELGEPATAASIAAATTVLSAIAALIKGVGNIFPNKGGAKGGKGKKGDAGDDGASDSGGGDSGSGDAGGDSGSGDSSSSETPATNTGDDSSAADPASSGDESSGGEENKSPGDDAATGSDEEGATNGSTTKTKAPAPAAKDDDDDDSGASNTPALRTAAKTTAPSTTKKVSFWQKKWVKPAAIGLGSLALIALMYKLLKPKSKMQHAVNGLPRKRKRKPKGDFLNGIKPKPKKGGTTPAKKKVKKKKRVITLL